MSYQILNLFSSVYVKDSLPKDPLQYVPRLNFHILHVCHRPIWFSLNLPHRQRTNRLSSCEASSSITGCCKHIGDHHTAAIHLRYKARTMVLGGQNHASSEWVAFADHNANVGFEAIVANVRTSSSSRPKPPARSESARRHTVSDACSVSSWMKQPISTDNLMAPVAPPPFPSRSEHPVANKHRPPRNRAAASHHDASSAHPGSNPVSSDESATSTDHTSRGRVQDRSASARPVARSVSRTRETVNMSMSPKDSSRRGRSRSRGHAGELQEGNVVQMESAHTRDRSTSRSRTHTTGELTGSSRQRSTISSSGGSRGRPPPSTSVTRRERSGSRTRSSSRTRSNSQTPATRTRSSSRTRSQKPPSTSRTRRELRVTIPSSNSVGPGVQAAKRVPSSARSVVSEDGRKDDNIGRDISFGCTTAGVSSSKEGNLRSRPPLMEKLFGDSVTDEAKQAYMISSPTASNIVWQRPDRFHSRILLTATVYHNTATNLWIATINTNQKGVAKNPAMASKYLKAFSFTSEREARESAIANAPPKMLPFQESTSCFICTGKFAMFRRASHCRNCGVCICTSCSTMWPAKMLPETYNLKKEAHVRVCKSCTQLSSAFKKALFDGDYEEAIALYGSGNINLRTPFPQFSKKKEEVMYPIHCAVAGGNLDILRWLVEDHFCPMKVIRTASGGKPKRGGSADQLILTSKNRSVLTISMTSLAVDIMRYLVVDHGVSIYDSRDLKLSLRALEAVLLAFPSLKGRRRLETSTSPRWDDGSFDDEHSFVSSVGGEQTMGDATQASSKKVSDSCIICYDKLIDCVMTPCGHQVCCLDCSKNLKACPVCNVKGQFIKIFRP